MPIEASLRGSASHPGAEPTVHRSVGEPRALPRRPASWRTSTRGALGAQRMEPPGVREADPGAGPYNTAAMAGVLVAAGAREGLATTDGRPLNISARARGSLLAAAWGPGTEGAGHSSSKPQTQRRWRAASLAAGLPTAGARDAPATTGGQPLGKRNRGRGSLLAAAHCNCVDRARGGREGRRGPSACTSDGGSTTDLAARVPRQQSVRSFNNTRATSWRPQRGGGGKPPAVLAP